MACNLTGGINTFNGCKDGVESITSIYLTSAGNVVSPTYSGGTVSNFTGATSGVYFEFKPRKNTSSFGSKAVVNAQNGTSYFDQSITLQFDKLDVAKRNVIQVLAQGTLNAIVKDGNSNYWMLGMINGLDLTESTFESGVAKGDFSGYKIVLNGKEASEMYAVASTLTTSLGI